MFRNPLTALVPRILVGLIIGSPLAFFKDSSGANKADCFYRIGVDWLHLLIQRFVLLFTWLGFTVMHTTFTGIPNNHLLGY